MADLADFVAREVKEEELGWAGNRRPSISMVRKKRISSDNHFCP